VEWKINPYYQHVKPEYFIFLAPSAWIYPCTLWSYCLSCIICADFVEKAGQRNSWARFLQHLQLRRLLRSGFPLGAHTRKPSPLTRCPVRVVDPGPGHDRIADVCILLPPTRCQKNYLDHRPPAVGSQSAKELRRTQIDLPRSAFPRD